MVYMLKTDKKVWNEFKEKGNGIPMSVRINAWVKYYGKNGFEEDEKEWLGCVNAATMLKSDLTTNEISSYSPNVDSGYWNLFKRKCREYNMSSNYAVSKMIERFNKKGSLFIEIVKW